MAISRMGIKKKKSGIEIRERQEAWEGGQLVKKEGEGGLGKIREGREVPGVVGVRVKTVTSWAKSRDSKGTRTVCRGWGGLGGASLGRKKKDN